jgi:hypothetical protein
VKSDIQKIRDLLRRAATHACRSRILLENPRDLERAKDQACLGIAHAETLLQRARILLIRNPELRADSLAQLPPEPET